VLAVFRHHDAFPPDQRFVVRQQLQRAALSVACNIVEGCARRTLNEYRHFVNVALASARETAYLVALSAELGYLTRPADEECRNICEAVVGSLQNLTTALEQMDDESPKNRPKPKQ